MQSPNLRWGPLKSFKFYKVCGCIYYTNLIASSHRRLARIFLFENRLNPKQRSTTHTYIKIKHV